MWLGVSLAADATCAAFLALLVSSWPERHAIRSFGTNIRRIRVYNDEPVANLTSILLPFCKHNGVISMLVSAYFCSKLNCFGRLVPLQPMIVLPLLLWEINFTIRNHTTLCTACATAALTVQQQVTELQLALGSWLHVCLQGCAKSVANHSASAAPG